MALPCKLSPLHSILVPESCACRQGDKTRLVKWLGTGDVVRDGRRGGGETERETSFPLSSALLPIRNWGLSSSEAKEGYNHLIHQLTCHRMAQTHYTSNTVSGLWEEACPCWSSLWVQASRWHLFFSCCSAAQGQNFYCGLLFPTLICSEYHFKSSCSAIVVRLMQNKCIVDSTLH